MRLERVEPESLKTVYALLQRYALTCGIPFEVMTIDGFQEIFDHSFYFWWRDEKDVYAMVNIGALEPQSRKAEFGVIALVAGYGAEACYAILRFGFETLNLNRMYAIVNADNAASLNLCRNHRMVEEGIIRQGRFKEGKYVDQVIFSVLATEPEIWKAGERRVVKNASSGSNPGSDPARRDGVLGVQGTTGLPEGQGSGGASPKGKP